VGEREWWADPRLARVGNQSVPSERRERRQAVLVDTLMQAAFSMLLPDDDSGNSMGRSQTGPKVPIGGQPQKAKPVKPPEKEARRGEKDERR
jgi:hypothetical protein